MPNKTLLPPPYLTLEDLNGATITGGTVTFLETGTAVLAVVYADANGLVISANPLTVDAAGRYTVFLTPGQVVDVEYRDEHGTLVKTVPAVQAVPAASGTVDVSGTLGASVTAGQVVYLSDGSGGNTAGRWYLADATLVYASQTVTIGLATTAGVVGTTVTIRIEGLVTGLAGLVVGAAYYVSNTAGALSLTVGLRARVVGQADTTTSLVLYANPAVPNQSVISSVATGTVVQFDPLNAKTVILGNASLLTIQGIKAGFTGQRVRFLTIGSGGQVDFVHQAAGAGAADRLINLVGSGPTSLSGGATKGWIEYEYDGATQRWRLTAHEQGGWISPVFSAADYTGTGGMTWTVAAGNVSRCAYRLAGRSLSVQLSVTNTTIGGVVSSALVRTIPGGYAGVGGGNTPIVALDGTAAQLPNALMLGTASPTLSFLKDPTGTTNWTLGTNALIYFDGTVEVT